MPERARSPLIVCLIAVVGCGPESGRDEFERDVIRVLERHCASAACHGVSPDAEARAEVIDWEHFHVRLDGAGVIADPGQAYETAKSRINTVEAAELSSLVRKPLAPEAGGLPHLGGVQFDDLDHPDARILLDWIAGETGGGEGMARDSLGPRERLFAERVLPHLAARQCMNQACHGRVAPFTNFEPPMVIDGEPVFSTAMVRANYDRARPHLFLGGPVEQSRLLRKGMPLAAGGIAHRGGNDIFFTGDATSDAAVRDILAWAAAERGALFPGGAPATTGIVFVRGPASAAAAPPFAHGDFSPGTDLYVLEPATAAGTLRNLTASSHTGPADIRDPAVSHDATRVAFAMRRSAAEALNIFEIGVDGSGLRQLTFDVAVHPGGGTVANAQPTYGPDGRIYFVSTRAGWLADGYDILDTDVWAVEPDTGILERITYDPSPQATPSFIGVGKSYGSLAFTMRRTINRRYQAPVFRMPLDHNKAYHSDPEIHIHHGVTSGSDIVYGARATPAGLFACVLLDRDNVWRGGKLALFERQFGPEIPIGAEDQAAVGGFAHAFSRAADGVTGGGISAGGLYRHPVPLPDGTLLVTFAPGPVDLGDPNSAPELGIHMASFDPASGAVARTPLIDEPGVAEYDAEPIVPRPLEDDPSHPPDWDASRTSTTGVLAYRHVQTLEALFGSLEQRGAKTLRGDLAYARLLEWIPISRDENALAPAGLGANGRVRILDEVPLAQGSLYLSVPADRPFRIQFLDGSRMAVGAQHNRWIHVAPGESFPGGVSPELYPVVCASCHGAISGDPGDVGGPIPDAITAASMTMATHENLDPRRPKDPVAAGASPIEVDFARHVAPLIARSCAGCHSGAAAAGGLDLSARPTTWFDSAYEALLAPGIGSGGGRAYVDADGSSAHRSYLVERLTGTELGAPRVLTGRCRGDPALSDAELLQVIRWIDTGASYRTEVP